MDGLDAGAGVRLGDEGEQVPAGGVGGGGAGGVDGADEAAYSESCGYEDEVLVLSESLLSMRDGRIAEQTLMQVWDK